MTTNQEASFNGWEMFSRYAFAPNELGYCGPEHCSTLLDSAKHGSSHDEILHYAQCFDGAWHYLEEISSANGASGPLNADVVHNYWIGGTLLDAVDGATLLQRLRTVCKAQPTGILDQVSSELVQAHHSFQVFVVYPWIRLLTVDPVKPLAILQACRIRWGTVESVDHTQVVMRSRPLQVHNSRLSLGEETSETVHWRKNGISLTPPPTPGDTVAAHWDWICDILTEQDTAALAAATKTTLELVNTVPR